MKLTVIILTKNEEASIKGCLESVKFADEIIIIDDNSADKTVDIGKKFKARIFKCSLNNDFSRQRNFGLSKACSDWILFVDADERVGNSLKNEIIQTINDPLAKYSGYFLKRTDIVWRKTLKFGETGNIKLLRLAKKNSGKWERAVHETWKVNGKVGVLFNPLDHYPHQILKEFLEQINFTSGIHAQANLIENKNSGLLKIIVWPVGKFINNWIFKLGFLDGGQGFIIALMMSLHSFLAWSKLWILQKN